MTQPPPKENDVMNPVQQNNETISEENFALAIQQLIQNMQTQMEEICNNVLQQIEEMSLRVDKLESTVQSLMQRSGLNMNEVSSQQHSQSNLTPSSQSQSESALQAQPNYHEQVQQQLIEYKNKKVVPRPIGKK